MALNIRKLSYALGAEITGVDLRGVLSDDTIAAIRKAWLEHLVLVLPGQDITPEQHIAFGARFGQLDDHAALYKFRHPDYPEIFLVTTKPKADGSPSDSRQIGFNWHSDMSYTLRPAMGSLLHCREITEVGGDTMFSNTYVAYDTLSEGFKKLIEPLWAVHDLTYGGRTAEGRDPEITVALRKANPSVMQPMVRVHSETGRKTLYVSEGIANQIVGMTIEESRPILEYLFQHAARPEFVYRHYWRRHDLVMWDNRCTMHNALQNRAPGMIRHMHRVTVLGTPCGQLYREAPAQQAAA